ncbi:hypothetical protein [Treponema sp.]
MIESLKIAIFRDNLENASFKACYFQDLKLDSILKNRLTTIF